MLSFNNYELNGGGCHDRDCKVLVSLLTIYYIILFCKNVFVIFWLNKCICLSVCLSKYSSLNISSLEHMCPKTNSCTLK